MTLALGKFNIRQYLIVSVWFPHAAFQYVSFWSFLDIKFAWVSLVCPIQSTRQNIVWPI